MQESSQAKNVFNNIILVPPKMKLTPPCIEIFRYAQTKNVGLKRAT